MRKYVFDTSALFTYIENEGGANIVHDLFEKAIQNKTEILVSVISLIELYYITAHEQNIETAKERLDLIKVLPLKIVELKIYEVETIGFLKSKYQISFADACIAGLAKSTNAELVHKDPEYEILPIKQKKLPYKKL